MSYALKSKCFKTNVWADRLLNTNVLGDPGLPHFNRTEPSHIYTSKVYFYNACYYHCRVKEFPDKFKHIVFTIIFRFKNSDLSTQKKEEYFDADYQMNWKRRSPIWIPLNYLFLFLFLLSAAVFTLKYPILCCSGLPGLSRSEKFWTLHLENSLHFTPEKLLYFSGGLL
jgi:hypothetical protein